MRSVCCYGGSAKYTQIQAFERGVESVIATPGRLNDLLEMKKADLSNVKFVVVRMMHCLFKCNVDNLQNAHMHFFVLFPYESLMRLIECLIWASSLKFDPL